MALRLGARQAAARAACLAALAFAACARGGPDAPLAGFDLVVVNVDTLRADHLGFHGYPRPTSPFLDQLASRSVVFERAISASSYTRESVAALLTGRLPSSSGSAGWHAAPSDAAPQLGERLRAAGYRTGFFSNTLMLQSPAFTRGFDEVQHLPARFDLSGEGSRLSERALRFARESGERPFAMYLHYLDPHAPYDPAPEDLARLAREELPPPMDLYREVAPRLAALRAEGFGPGEARFEAMLLRYDAEILGTDAAIARLFRGLEAQGAADRLLFVVTADHGEEFLEHGGVEHGWTLYEESVHVPLLFWAGAALAPARVPARVSQVDLLPTLVALLGLPAAGLPPDGAPLFEVRGGIARPRAPERAPVAELLIPFRNVARVAYAGDWKVLAAWRWVPPDARFATDSAAGRARGGTALDLAGSPELEAFFDLGRDPREREERTAPPAAAAAPLRARLAELPARLAAMPAPAAPLAPGERERLRALGYAPD